LRCGLDVNSKDFRESTPLHWAAFAGAENALNYLLAFGAAVDSQDLKGITPLHLAVKSSEQVHNTRLIRGLLLRGASKSKMDSNGLFPIDLTQEMDISF
jgi:ankyrin repeat protein